MQLNLKSIVSRPLVCGCYYFLRIQQNVFIRAILKVNFLICFGYNATQEIKLKSIWKSPIRQRILTASVNPFKELSRMVQSTSHACTKIKQCFWASLIFKNLVFFFFFFKQWPQKDAEQHQHFLHERIQALETSWTDKGIFMTGLEIYD